MIFLYSIFCYSIMKQSRIIQCYHKKPELYECKVPGRISQKMLTRNSNVHQVDHEHCHCKGEAMILTLRDSLVSCSCVTT